MGACHNSFELGHPLCMSDKCCVHDEKGCIEALPIVCCTVVKTCFVKCTVGKVSLLQHSDERPVFSGMCVVKKRPIVVVRIVPLASPDKAKDTTAGVHMEDWRTNGSVTDTWVWGALPGAADREALSFPRLETSTNFQLSVQHWTHTNNAGTLPPKILGVADFRLAEDILEAVADEGNFHDKVLGTVSLRVAAEVVTANSGCGNLGKYPAVGGSEERSNELEQEPNCTYPPRVSDNEDVSVFEPLVGMGVKEKDTLGFRYETFFGSVGVDTPEEENSRSLNFAPRL